MADEITCGVFLFSTVNKKILVCHATRTPLTMWTIPKGLKNDDEDSLEAALRELYEETNIILEDSQVISISALPRKKYKGKRKFLDAFLIVSTVDPSGLDLKCHSYVDGKFPETDKFDWISIHDLETKVHHSQSDHFDELLVLLGEFL